MLAGLLFAIEEAEDRPGRLAATLPFGGVTLIEHQARGLVAAGAAQLIVLVQRVTPELLGALHRIGRRGVAVDAVRSAAEAAGKLHPLAHVLMLADGLVTTDAAIAAMEQGPAGDALLVLPAADAVGAWERVGAQMAWAGIARLDPRRVAELAALPPDYDVQSTLLRLADQAGGAHVLLPAAALRHGHGIELRAAALAARSRLVLASLVRGRRSWFDRWILGPVARLTLPWLVERSVSGLTIGAVGGGVALAGIAGTVLGWQASGMLAALLGCLALGLGTALSELRDEMPVERGQRIALAATPAAAALALGWSASDSLSATPLVIAVSGVVAGVLGVRAIPEHARPLWWGTPPAYLLLLLTGCVAGEPGWGLAIAAGYAAATLAAGIEALRGDA